MGRNEFPRQGGWERPQRGREAQPLGMSSEESRYSFPSTGASQGGLGGRSLGRLCLDYCPLRSSMDEDEMT